MENKIFCILYLVIRSRHHFYCPITFFFRLIIYGSCFHVWVIFSGFGQFFSRGSCDKALTSFLLSINFFFQFDYIWVMFSGFGQFLSQGSCDKTLALFLWSFNFFFSLMFYRSCFSVFAGFAQFLSVTSYNLVHISV